MRSWHLAIGLTTCALVGGIGCGGAQPHQAKGPALRTSVTELEARTRSDRRKIDDLEQELTSLKLRVAEAQTDAVPKLPVEVRAPAAAVEDSPAGEYAEVVGVDEDGVEIVYMGDAARAGSVAPRLPGRNPAYAVPRSPAREPGSSAPSTGTPPTIDRQMDEASWGVSVRLPVTAGVGPSVDQRVQTPPAMPAAEDLPPVTMDPATSTSARGAHAHARLPEPRSRRSAPSVRHPEPLSPRADQAKVLYDQHMAKLQAGDHDAAATGFRALVSEYPEHELADNAQYWLGESLYARKLYRDALAAFRAVVSRYPRGNKVPDALLKIGFCHQTLGEIEQARTALARVIEMFPKSHPAALAAERLETLGK